MRGNVTENKPIGNSKDNPSSSGSSIILIKGASIDCGIGSLSVFHDVVNSSVALRNKPSAYSSILS
jgi:hypothetical protein